MRLAESGEMYLETILRLSEKKEKVRSVDVAEEMGYSKPSVSRAVNLLKNNGFILIDSLGAITLTEKGLSAAERIYERHRVLSELFMSLGVDEKTATEDACKVEHVISDATFEAIKQHRNTYGGQRPD
ncbi:MAG: metal-dependent transcriptional regulator [Clostridia bacterium]|nr:metal-dependent transcriptional regulator [Clostridia bacterium]